jgi:hypothetical protein
MARTKSDDVRDAKRAAKIKEQSIDWLNPNAKGETKGWLAEPTVGKSPYLNKPNPDGIRIDWEEKHHQMGLNLYERFTEGLSPEQRTIIDDKLAAKGLYRGNTGLNRIDLPRRLHTSSKYPEYEGAHQVTMREGIDSRAELDRIAGLTPDQKMTELDQFVDSQVRHRQVGQQKFMEQFMLEPGNNPDTNKFGGNFSQQVLQERNPAATAKQAKALKVERAAAGVRIKNGVAKFGKGLSKVIPGSADDAVIGGVMAGVAAGGVLLAGGSPVQAGEAALETGVDVATSELQGGNLADGTLQSNQDKVKQTLYQEPKNTAAPTGDTTFDAVAQPLIKGLAGQPMHPTSANGVIQLKR